MPLNEVLQQRVSRLRKRQGLSAQALADRCADLGAPEVTRSIIANIENGRRRSVTVDELLALAAALNVAPLHLLLAVGEQPAGADVVQLLGRRRMGSDVEAWLHGQRPLNDDDDDWEEWLRLAPRDARLLHHSAVHPAVLALDRLLGRVRRLVADPSMRRPRDAADLRTLLDEATHAVETVIRARPCSATEED